MRTHNIPSYKKSMRSLLCLLTLHYYQPSLALTTRLELIFMVPKVFEPLKFDCIYAIWKKLYLKVHQNMTIKYVDIASYVMSLSQSRCWAHVFCFINAYSLSVDFIKEG